MLSFQEKHSFIGIKKTSLRRVYFCCGRKFDQLCEKKMKTMLSQPQIVIRRIYYLTKRISKNCKIRVIKLIERIKKQRT